MGSLRPRVVPMIAVGASALVLAGCAQEPILVDQVGITVDKHGQPVVVLAPCSGSIDTIMLSLLPDHSQTQNGPVAAWKRGTAVTTMTRLALNSPDSNWTGMPITVKDDQRYIASAASSTHDRDAFNDITFTGKQIAALDPTRVYLNSPDPASATLVAHPAAEFQAWACALPRVMGAKK